MSRFDKLNRFDKLSRFDKFNRFDKLNRFSQARSRNECASHPTVMSNRLLPIELDTAMSPKPFRATSTLVIRSGMLVPAARNVRPITWDTQQDSRSARQSRSVSQSDSHGHSVSQTARNVRPITWDTQQDSQTDRQSVRQSRSFSQ